MRKTKAMLEEELEYYRMELSKERKVNMVLERSNKELIESLRYFKSFGDNLNKGFNACEVVANAVSHALRLQMNANGVR